MNEYLYWEFGKYSGKHISKTPFNYVEWFVSSKGYDKLSKKKKEGISEYMKWYKETYMGIKEEKVELIINSGEWHSISELPTFDSEVEVRPFTAILIFKGDYFVDSKGRSVSLELVDEWRYTDKYLQK
jgi:hypothetical protein